MRATWLLAAGALAVSGCAGTTRHAPASVPAQEVAPKISPAKTSPVTTSTVEPVLAPAASVSEAAPAEAGESEDGVMHIVQPGQTLWRIARAYDVPLETIARVNNIPDPTRVDVGTPVFIPGARATIDVAPFPAPLPGPRHPAQLPIATAGAYTWPIENGEFMRPFGEPRRNHMHAGVDIRGLRGQDIHATRDGVVAFSGPTASGYGTMVILDHGDGVQSLYAHAQSVLVHTGDAVTRGETIARVGRTGNATTEHCHFELRLENHPVDPMPYFQSVAQVRR